MNRRQEVTIKNFSKLGDAHIYILFNMQNIPPINIYGMSISQGTQILLAYKLSSKSLPMVWWMQ